VVKNARLSLTGGHIARGRDQLQGRRGRYQGQREQTVTVLSLSAGSASGVSAAGVLDLGSLGCIRRPTFLNVANPHDDNINVGQSLAFGHRQRHGLQSGRLSTHGPVQGDKQRSIVAGGNLKLSGDAPRQQPPYPQKLDAGTSSRIGGSLFGGTILGTTRQSTTRLDRGISTAPS